MTIENRNLSTGTKLVAKFKKVTYKAEVVQTEEGVRYKLEDGRQFKSLSAAGMAITGGPINGWSFWSVAGEEAQQQTTETKPVAKAKKSGSSKGKIIRRTPNQQGT